MDGSNDTIVEKFDTARRELLDPGLRNNTLLNYRRTRRRGIEIVSPNPQAVYSQLVGGGGKFCFVADDEEGDVGTAETETYPSTSRQKSLVTRLPEAELSKRLLASYYDARRSLEETGVNTLFLALGMLEWYESDSSEEPRYAPLLLVPVELARENAQDSFKTAWTGDEIGENLSLAMKLKSEFGIEYPLLPDEEDFDAACYFDSVQQAVSCMRRWLVQKERITLGFFSFSKFLMFKDLNPANWPDDAKPHEHEVIRALLGEGFSNGDPMASDDQCLDELLAPMDSFYVVDADSTQTLALMEVKAGHHLVIQGPPGTGKSQTIINLIAESVAAKKSVLFVSEKMAALKVVKRRLDEIGLGDACLELHSHQTNKKAVIDELKRVMDLGQPKLGEVAADFERLATQRTRLNDYCTAVNTPIGQSGFTPIQAEGKFMLSESELRRLGVDALDLKSEHMLTWSQVDFVKYNGMVRELAERLQAVGHTGNPYRASERCQLLPSDQDRLDEIVQSFKRCDDAVHECMSAMARILDDRPLPKSIVALRRDSTLLHHIGLAPELAGVDLLSPHWQTGVIAKALDAGKVYSKTHASFDSVLLPKAWDSDVVQWQAAIQAHINHFWRRLLPEYREAKRHVASLFISEPPEDAAALLEATAAIVSEQASRMTLAQHEDVAQSVLGCNWAGTESDWAQLEACVKWVASMSDKIASGMLPSGSLELAARVLPALNRSDAICLSEKTASAADAWVGAFHNLVEFLELPARVRNATLETALDKRVGYVRSLSEHKMLLEKVTALNVALDECRMQPGLEPTAVAAKSWEHEPQALVPCFARSYALALLDEAFRSRPQLGMFDGVVHDSILAEFRRLDKTVLEYNRARVLKAHWGRIPQYREPGGQMGFIRREAQKQRRHVSVRKLMEKAGNAVATIKPVMMMSPLSVATYLPPSSVQFDVVVFDEASQVKPVDAFGAIIRGNQVVVVGDSKQLPPSLVFDSVLSDDDSDQIPTTDIESVLGLFEGQGASKRMLQWHYRSRHDSLIAVSNKEFYDNKLVIFPAPKDRDEVSGVVFRYLPNTAYDRGGTATNPDEAKAVANAAMRHARTFPGKTLGIVAFSLKQADIIQDQMELLRRNHPETERFFADHPNEPFFVKNLENVQGDERDVIFISVGYGHTEERYLAMQFGPLSKDGGWRRLNVLITRARERCEVFSNITADDIDLSRTQSLGVKALKTYLRYAKDGIMDIPQATAAEGDSPFEDWVARRLRADGYSVDHQVGSGGFFIDLAIRESGRYLLGIECDGATYHSSRSARDRDRLRQAVLEGLGWRIHRIWSTDWFRNTDQQYRKLVEAIERAKAHGGNGCQDDVVEIVSDVQTAGAPEREVVSADAESPPLGTPYMRARVSFYQCDVEYFLCLPLSELSDLLYQVVRQEGPIHYELAFRRVANSAGLQNRARVFSKLRSAMHEAVNSRRAVVLREDFLWLADQSQVMVRDRSDLDSAEKKIEWVPPEEIDEAISRVAWLGLGMSEEDVTREAAKVLGFKRVGPKVSSQIKRVVDKMLRSGKLVRDKNGHIFMQ